MPNAKPPSTQQKSSSSEKDKIKELQKKVTALEKDKKSLEQTIKEKDEKISQLEAIKDICGEGVSVSKQTDNNKREVRLTEENGHLKEQLKRLTEENSQLKEQLKSRDSNEHTHKSTTKKNAVDTEIIPNEKTVSELTQKVKEQEEKIKNQQKEEVSENLKRLIKMEKENADLKKTISDLQSENKQLKEAQSTKQGEKAERLEEVERGNKNLRNNINELKTENKKLTQVNSTKQQKKSDRSKSPKMDNTDLQEAGSRIKYLEDENKKLMEEKNKAVKDIDNLKHRLSQIAGSKLTDNNPGIADLSDPNRPLNLGEKFSELYDNQWTDALEEMDSKFKNEKQTIQNLLEIVRDAYRLCVERSDAYFEKINDGIKKVFKTKELSSLQLKLTKDFRKSMAVHLVSDLEEEFCNGKNDGEHISSYRRQCIRVCWFMAVQDPPVFIDVKENVTGKKFDTDKYKYYTNTGKAFDYLVWPVLYLHKDGPVIGKGVAQGK